MKKNFMNIRGIFPKYFSPGLKITLCCIIMAMAQGQVNAQEKQTSTATADKKISGKIVSATGEPLIGATVGIKNTTNRTTTDADGNFELSVPGNAILEITHVGYKQQEISVSGKTNFQINLEASEITMSDVVVVGYTSKKSSLTGAITAVNMSDLKERRVSDVAQLLQGQVAGVQVTQSTGAPGDGINITIRGVGTFAGSSPLFIVDGTPSTDISFLNPTDIQSMTVLKDAAAAAIYGSRASGGVIVITTKSGRKGKSNLDINYYNGIQKVVNLPKMLNATQYMNKMEESWNNSGYPGTNPY